MPELPLVGDEFAGYHLRSVLGRGGMSVVYQAENPRLGNVIALKVLSPELAADDIFRARFLEESRIAAAMNHPHVIPIHDTGSSDGLLYIAMRYVSGTNLGQMIKKRGRLQPETAVLLLSQAARALDAAHRRGLVHRDVKPANLLVERGNDDSDPDHLYLADFGISKMASGRTGLTSTGQFVGTVDYVAPEQIRGLSVLGMADQYSLGCVLYECLTGRVPFEKDLNEAIMWAHMEEQPTRPTLLRPDLPPEVDDMFSRVLAKQPGDRYASCREFMAAASDSLGSMAARPNDRSPRALRPAPPGRRPAPPPADRQEIAHDQGRGQRDLTASIVRPGLQPLENLPPDEAGPHGSGSDSGRPRHGRGGRRISVLLLAAAFVVAAGIGIVIGAWTESSGRQPAAGPSAGAPLAPPALSSTPTKTLKQALAAVNVTVWTTGYLPPKSCTFLSAAYARCSHPYEDVTEAVFQNYSSPAALYKAYETAIKQGNNGHFPVNTQDCGSTAPPTDGAEVSWNHSAEHSQAYSIKQLETGKLSPSTQAAGRMFCVFNRSTFTDDIIWTQTDGNMLGEVTGASHLEVWDWWLHVHHNIAFNGQPMGAMGTVPETFPAA
jgi:serine/threonine protein kinase